MVMVSTDDEEIAETAEKYGAVVPFMRPENISDDYATTMDVLKHSAQWCNDSGHDVRTICCIYATAPLLTGDIIRKSSIVFEDHNCDYVFAVVPFEYPVQRALIVNRNGRVKMFDSNMVNVRSQDLEDVYHDAGQFYWCNVTALLEERPIFSDKSIPYILPRTAAIDIDTNEDWLIAEAIYSAIKVNQ